VLRFVRTLLLTALLAGAAAVPGVASATSMIALDLSDQAAESTALVEAVVGEQTPVITTDQWYTDTKLAITAVHGGEAPDAITVRQVGGVTEERVAFIPGDARVAPGQRIVAFVRKVQGQWYFTALGQSVWHVEGAEERLHRDVGDMALYQRSFDGHVIPVNQSLPEYTTRAELLGAAKNLEFGGVQ
jgi:hypothetical protein